MAVIMAASMIMSHGVTAMASTTQVMLHVEGDDTHVHADSESGDVKSEVKGNVEAESESMDSVAVSAEAEDGKEASVKVEGNATSQNFDATAVEASAHGTDSEGNSSKASATVTKDAEAEGVYSTGAGARSEGGAEASVNVGDDVKSDGRNAAYGVGSSASGTSKSSVTVGGDVTAKQSVPEGSPDPNSRGIGVNGVSQGKSESKVTVGGDVTAESDVFAQGVGANAFVESNTSVTVNKDVEAEGGTTSTGVSAAAYENSEISVNVGNVSSESKGRPIMVETPDFKTASGIVKSGPGISGPIMPGPGMQIPGSQGVLADAYAGSKASVTVNGDIESEASSDIGMGYPMEGPMGGRIELPAISIGAQATAAQSSEAKVNVKGNVDSTGASNAVGAAASNVPMMGPMVGPMVGPEPFIPGGGVLVEGLVGDDESIGKDTSVSEVNIDGKVTVSSDNEAEGVFAVSSDGVKSSVSVKNGIDVSADGKYEAHAAGVRTRAYTYGTSTGIVKGDVNVSAEGEEDVNAVGVSSIGYSDGTSIASVDGNVDVSAEGEEYVSAVGVDATSREGKSTASVKGDVTVKVVTEYGEAIGVGAQANYRNDRKAMLSVDKSISEIGLSGIREDTYTPKEGTAEVKVDGDVTVKDEAGSAAAIGVTASGGKGGKVKVDVTGDVIIINNLPDDERHSAYAAGIGIDNVMADTTDINIGGSIKSDGNGVDIRTHSDGTDRKSDANVTVDGNVQAKLAAFYLNNEDSADSVNCDFTVKGTLSGEEHNIVLSDSVNTDNLNITVWKVDTKKNDKIVESFSYDEGEENFTSDKRTEAVEKAINYIIRVQPVETSGAGFSVDSSQHTKNAKGDYTAHQGDRVYLAVSVPNGYEVESFYNADGASDVSVLMVDGRYYLEVPRGGGVNVGMKLKSLPVEEKTVKRNEIRIESNGSHSESRDEYAEIMAQRNSAVNNMAGGNMPGNFTFGAAPAEKTAAVQARVQAPQVVMVNGQMTAANVKIEANTDVVDRAFEQVLAQVSTTGIYDNLGNNVSIPQNAVVKESFSFISDVVSAHGMVATTLTINNYSQGDVIICTYYDANGKLVTMAINPLVVVGNQLSVIIPANCSIAIAGANTAAAYPMPQV